MRSSSQYTSRQQCESIRDLSKAIIAVAMDWPDVTRPLRSLAGFTLVGCLERAGSRLIAEERLDVVSFPFVTSGEDIPNAYRLCPVAQGDVAYNVVAAKNPETGRLCFFVVKALLFGYAASVAQFARLSKFLEGYARRMCGLVLSMYVDDSHQTDLRAGRGSSERLGKLAFFFS